MEKEKRLAELKTRLKELQKLDPSHCYGKNGFIPHSMTPEHYQKVEDIEQEIKELTVGQSSTSQ